MMTIKETQKRFDAIKALINPYDDTNSDCERLHAMEAHLHQDVLEAIRDKQAEDPFVMAEIAMKTREFTFTRSY